MPLLIEKDNGLVFMPMLQCLDDTVCLFGHGLIQVLALLVVLVNLLSQFLGSFLIFLDKQGHRFIARLHSARCIDTRPYLEDDVA